MRDFELTVLGVIAAVVIYGTVLSLYRAFVKLRNYRRIQQQSFNKQQRAYIKESLIKLMLNPFDDNVYWWTKLNPKTHIWEWKRKATDAEVLAYENITLSEEVGDKILELGDYRQTEQDYMEGKE